LALKATFSRHIGRRVKKGHCGISGSGMASKGFCDLSAVLLIHNKTKTEHMCIRAQSMSLVKGGYPCQPITCRIGPESDAHV
jgi:hypothetical protein